MIDFLKCLLIFAAVSLVFAFVWVFIIFDLYPSSFPYWWMIFFFLLTILALIMGSN